jgi:hypothetical protein
MFPFTTGSTAGRADYFGQLIALIPVPVVTRVFSLSPLRGPRVLHMAAVMAGRTPSESNHLALLLHLESISQIMVQATSKLIHLKVVITEPG